VKSRVKLPLILASAAIALGLLFVVISPRPGISLTLLEYKRWPHGAMLLLSNGTPSTIRYLSESGDTPAGNLVLCLQKTSERWTSSSRVIRSTTSIDPRTRKSVDFFYMVNPAAQPKPGDRLDILQSKELRPGERVRFFARLEPGELRKVGTVCYLPLSPLEEKLRPWLQRLQQWCRMKTSVPGQKEVWCPTLLTMPPEPDPVAGH